MTTGQIFTKWDETHSELWSHQPIRLEHEMHKSPAFSMDDLLREFVTETNESLDVVDVELVRFEQDPNNAQILNNIFRLVHTIKGTCGFLNLPRLEALTHAAEALFEWQTKQTHLGILRPLRAAVAGFVLHVFLALLEIVAIGNQLPDAVFEHALFV